MPSQAQFSQQSPGTGGLRVLYRDLGGVRTIKAITISVESLEGVNLDKSLRELEQIRFVITSAGSPSTLITGLGSRHDGFYYYDVDDLVISDVSGSNNSVVNISPYLPEKFRNTEYDALLSNASSIRRSNFRYEVDRLEGNNVVGGISGVYPVRPTNWLSIVSGSATFAEVQDSNYTTTGIVNARYNGAKTNANTYGSISPAVSGKSFEAASYLTSSADNFICSQSLSDRTLETYLFEGTADTPESGSRIFQFDKSRIIPVTNRKVWVKDNRTILVLDNLGYVAGSITQCTV